jgi:hypothetical protein
MHVGKIADMLWLSKVFENVNTGCLFVKPQDKHIRFKRKSKKDCGDISDELRLPSQIRLFSEKKPIHIPA